MNETNSARDNNEAIKRTTSEDTSYRLPYVPQPTSFNIPFNPNPDYLNSDVFVLPDLSFDHNIYVDLQRQLQNGMRFENPFYPVPMIPYHLTQQIGDSQLSLQSQSLTDSYNSSMETMSSITNSEVNNPSSGNLRDERNSRIVAKDDTPNPRKIAEILRELQIAQDDMDNLRNNNCGLHALRQERNRIASKICRHKKKATFETNKLKSYHLEAEYNALRGMIKEVCNFLLNNGTTPYYGNMYTKFYETIKEKYLPEEQIAGNTDYHVDKILRNVALGKNVDIYKSKKYTTRK